LLKKITATCFGSHKAIFILLEQWYPVSGRGWSGAGS